VSEVEGLYRDAVGFLNTRITYLQGSARGNRPEGPISPHGIFVPGTRYEFDVMGVGREEKRPPLPPTDPGVWRLPFEDFLAGAYTYRIPVSYRISSVETTGLTLRLGTWSRDVGNDEECMRRSAAFQSLLSVLYPVVNMSTPHPFQPAHQSSVGRGGLVTGHPTAKAPVAGDNVLPIDRVIRALGQRPWSVSILASPEPETMPQLLREALIEELTFAQNAQRATGHDLPVVKQFTELVEPALRDLLNATTMGAWRTAVYLEADPATYPMLASVWRSVFSGNESTPETIHIVDLGAEQTSDLSRAWAFPLDTNATDPSQYQHPFEYQTLLSSTQLAAYVHLPSVEVAGFWVDVIPRYDVSVVGHRTRGFRVPLGTVVAHPTGNRDIHAESSKVTPAGAPLDVSLPTLSRHVLIAGVTGSGKTTTSVQLLRGLYAKDIPFLVIEPAKREYRQMALALKDDPISERLARDLTVFSVSITEGTPFRINPFEVEEGTSVTEHIDLLRSVFAASFGDMWTPLPQVLEQCMLGIYRDRGWDLVTGLNRRLHGGEDRALAFPTLRELAGIVDEIVDDLGFDPEARDRVRGSLSTRIDGLRVGSKGLLFDTRSSFSMASLLGQPAILELERLADESDKAFLMGLLLIRLVEFRRGEQRAKSVTDQPPDGLRHMLVIEEAHRLLANVTHYSGSDNTARALAVESFSNLLAEIRAYGQGIVVVDQIPTKLASDVIKNTNLKIAHRVVDEADRKVLGGSMAMNDAQMAGLATLAQGEAAVFGDGDDAPLLVHISLPSPAAPMPLSGHAHNSDIMSIDRMPLHWSCACTGEDYNALECATASLLVKEDEVRQGLLRIATGALRAKSLDELSSAELLEAVRRHSNSDFREPLAVGCLAARGAEWLADDWGARRSWSFDRTHEFATELRRLLVKALVSRSEGLAGTSSADVLATYQHIAMEQLRRTTDPYPSCSAICAGDLAGYCLYREASASTLERADMLAVWDDARTLESPDVEGYPRTWSTCINTIAPQMLGPGAQPAPSQAAALCFAQQAVAAESPSWPPWAREQFISDLLVLANAEPVQYDSPEPTANGPTDEPTNEVAL
jgi:Helicase HerA, central domain